MEWMERKQKQKASRVPRIATRSPKGFRVKNKLRDRPGYGEGRADAMVLS